MWKEPRMSKLTDNLKHLVSMFGTICLIVSEIKQLLPAAKLTQKYSKTLFITVLTFKDNSLHFAFFCRPIALPNFVNLWCSVFVVFRFILKHILKSSYTAVRMKNIHSQLIITYQL